MKRLPAISALLALSLALAACQGTTNQNSQPTTGSAASYIGSQSDLRASRYGSDVEEAYQRGSRHFSGLGVPKNRAEAARWFRVAAEGSHPEAQSFLGMMYENGMGVRQDSVEALKWYRLAAALGDANAAADERRLARRMSNSEIAEAERKARDWKRTHATGSRSGQLATNGAPGRTQSAEQSYAEHLARSYVPDAVPAATDSGHSRTPAGNEHRAPSPDAPLTAAEAAFNRGAEAYAREDYAQAARWMREAAEQGHARAQDNLGIMYTIGLGVPQDGRQAERWLLEAAKQGYAPAQKNLGILYRDGQGGARQDPAAAVRWFRRAANQGNAEAQFALGSIYIVGFAGRRDEVEGVRLMMAAAEQGHASALYGLGLLYESGTGVVRDLVEALMYYGLAEIRGEEAAQPMFDRLAGELSQDQVWEAKERSSAWAKKFNTRMEERRRETEEQERASRQSAKRAPSAAPPRANGGGDGGRIALNAFEQGLRAYQRGDAKEAARHLRIAAEHGQLRAQALLGLMYSAGDGVPQDDRQAVRWLRPAAERGDELAQSGLGSQYEYGHGVPQDYAQAVRWYRLAADQGNAEAQTRLGHLHVIGKGVPLDHTEAMKWVRQAANQDLAHAQLLLGILYNEGEGIAHDPIAALMWMTLAAEKGDEFIEGMRARNAQRLTAAGVAEAERRAEDWRRAYRARQRG